MILHQYFLKQAYFAIFFFYLSSLKVMKVDHVFVTPKIMHLSQHPTVSVSSLN